MSIIESIGPVVPMCRCRQRGFTLIEVMLAMLITAFIALMAYNGLSAAVSAAEGVETQTQRLVDIQLPFTVLERDLRHAVLRPIVDEYDTPQPALAGGELERFLLRLTRRGRANPTNAPRGDLQRVRYVLENRELWRESWGVLDRTDDTAGFQRTLLLNKVARVQLAFLDGKSAGAATSPLGGEWVDSWDRMEALPLAVEVTIELEDIGELRRVIAIPSDI